MRAGYAKADITPKEKITLCGFSARCNEPFDRVDDTLWVHALIVDEAGSTVLVLSFDMLGFGAYVTEQILQNLDDIEEVVISRENCIL